MQELMASTIKIAAFNVNGGLKPKGKSNNGWCRFDLNLSPTKGMCYEAVVKHGGGDISEGSLVFCRSKGDGAGGGPLPSKSANQYFGNMQCPKH